MKALDTLELGPDEVAAERRDGEPLVVVDVREPWETDICEIEGSLKIPLATLPASVGQLPQDKRLVLVCHHGARSMQAVMWLRHQGFDNAVNLRGGIDAWARAVDPAMATY